MRRERALKVVLHGISVDTKFMPSTVDFRSRTIGSRPHRQDATSGKDADPDIPIQISCTIHVDQWRSA